MSQLPESSLHQLLRLILAPSPMETLMGWLVYIQRLLMDFHLKQVLVVYPWIPLLLSHTIFRVKVLMSKYFPWMEMAKKLSRLWHGRQCKSMEHQNWMMTYLDQWMWMILLETTLLMLTLAFLINRMSQFSLLMGLMPNAMLMRMMALMPNIILTWNMIWNGQ